MFVFVYVCTVYHFQFIHGTAETRVVSRPTLKPFTDLLRKTEDPPFILIGLTISIKREDLYKSLCLLYKILRRSRPVPSNQVRILGS